MSEKSEKCPLEFSKAYGEVLKLIILSSQQQRI